LAAQKRLYARIVWELQFDPGRWRCRNGDLLHAYTAKKGKLMVKPWPQLKKSILDKWKGILPANFQPPWGEIWHPSKLQKEVAYLWSVIHKAIAVNSWRAQLFPGINISCSCCDQGLEETIMHQFVECDPSKLAWDFALTVLYRALAIPQTKGRWPTLTWQHRVAPAQTTKTRSYNLDFDKRISGLALLDNEE